MFPWIISSTSFIRGEEKRFFGLLGLRLPVLLGSLASAYAGLAGLPWLAAGLLALASLPALQGSVLAASLFIVNGLGHCLGYRRFDTRDTSHNVVAWDWLCLGEALHNNHHAYSGRANMAMPGELEPAYWLLRGLRRVGLVRTLSGG